MIAHRVSLAACVVAVALCAVAAAPASAQTAWNVASGDWTVGGNWTAGVPDGATNATVDNAGTAILSAGGAGLAGNLYLGDAASGTLFVQDGGTLAASDSYLGRAGGSTGTATVTGAGSAWTNTGGLYIGGSDVADGGTGSLTVADTATVSAGGTLKLWSAGDTLIVDGGAVAAQSFSNAGGSTFTFRDGTVTVDGGTYAGGALLMLNGDDAAALPSLVLNNLSAAATLGGDPIIGNALRGRLTLSGGTDATNVNAYLGMQAGSTGEVTVTGAGSTWTNTGDLYVGFGGAGTLAVAGGAAVQSASGVIASAAGSTGGATVTGAGSDWTATGALTVGLGGDGTLAIENGATVQSDTGVIASAAGSTGDATVTGAGSLWLAGGALTVGLGGDGTLAVENGATAQSASGVIASAAGSTGGATVTGAGSDWTATGALTIGLGGGGTLAIEDGGAVQSGGGVIASEAGSTGGATVTGAGSDWTATGGLIVGWRGDGTLTVENGGAVQSAGGFIAVEAGSTGGATVTGAGSTWTNTGGLYIGGSDVADGGTGTLNVTAGGVVEVNETLLVWDAGTVTVGAGSTLVATDAQVGDGGSLVVNGTVAAFNAVTIGSGGLLSGTGSAGQNVVTQAGGRVAPGNSIGTLTVPGDYTLAAGGTLDVEVERAGAATNSDLLDVGGAATLEAGSAVQVTDISLPGDVIQTNDTFTVITAAGGVTDLGAAVTSASALLSFTPAVVGTDYVLTAHQVSSFAGVAVGSNNASVAAALDGDSPTATGDYGTLINGLLMLDANGLNAALPLLGGQAHLAASGLALRSGSQMNGALSGYLAGRRAGTADLLASATGGPQPSLMLADAACDPFVLGQVLNRTCAEPNAAPEGAPMVPQTKSHFYARPFGDFYRRDTTTNQLGYGANTAGVQLGMDRRAGENALVGLAASYGHADIRLHQHGGSGEIDTFRVGPYASLFRGDAFLDGSMSYGVHWTEMDRKIPAAAAPGRTAESDYVAHDLTLYLGGGYEFHVAGWSLVPSTSVQYTWFRRPGFSESGAGAANLDVDADESDSLQSRAGLSLSRVFDLGKTKVCPEVFGGWWHEYLGEQSLDARFNQGVTRFGLASDVIRDGAYYGAGVSVLLTEHVSAFVRWDGAASGRDRANAVSAGVGLRF